MRNNGKEFGLAVCRIIIPPTYHNERWIYLGAPFLNLFANLDIIRPLDIRVAHEFLFANIRMRFILVAFALKRM